MAIESVRSWSTWHHLRPRFGVMLYTHTVICSQAIRSSSKFAWSWRGVDRPTLFEAIRNSPIGGPPTSSDHPKNYRPVSNLTFVSKDHWENNCDWAARWVATYRLTVWCLACNQYIGIIIRQKPHFFELSQTSSISSADEGKVTILGLIDIVSATFNMVDHTILLDQMRVAFGIDGLAPEWIMTFLVDRTQQVMSTVIYWSVEFRRTKEIGSRSTSFPAVHGRIVWNLQEIRAQSYLIKRAGRQSRRRCATFHRECAADRPMDAVQTVQQTGS